MLDKNWNSLYWDNNSYTLKFPDSEKKSGSGNSQIRVNMGLKKS